MSDPRRVTVTGTSSHKKPGRTVDAPRTERSRVKRRAPRPGGPTRAEADEADADRREHRAIFTAPVESLIKEVNPRVKGTERFWIREALKPFFR